MLAVAVFFLVVSVAGRVFVSRLGPGSASSARAFLIFWFVVARFSDDFMTRF